MKIKLVIFFLLTCFSAAAQQQTKQQLIDFINAKLNQSMDVELYTSSKNFKNKLKSAKLRLDTGNMVVYDCTMEMKYGEKHIVVFKSSFNPAQIVAIALISDEPNKFGMGYLSVVFDRKVVSVTSKRNDLEPKSGFDASIEIHFRQKDKKMFDELKKAFLDLKTLYKN